MSADCRFCRIAAGDVDAHRLHEGEHMLAFLDANPATTTALNWGELAANERERIVEQIQTAFDREERRGHP